ncbi:MAG: hypothetical protein K2X39_03075, partial [Silvanigrellaceae bacterium]|nr:hypothetical protein [Silvanigrellaceae bacterium]
MIDLKEFELNEFSLYRYSLVGKETKVALLFAHANAIPSKTYQLFLEELANALQAVIYTYDMRGIGKTQTQPSST